MNLRWGHILQDEAPIPGAKYNQYTIYYCKKVGVQGMDHVGDLVTAITRHIFFVNDSLKTAWETALANVGDLTEVQDGQVTPTIEDLANDGLDAANSRIDDLIDQLNQQFPPDGGSSEAPLFG